MNNTLSFNKSQSNAYKTDRSEEYFKRYYRGASFNVNDVTRVSKTKMEEMERLEDDYRKKLKLRNKKQLGHQHRYSYSGARD